MARRKARVDENQKFIVGVLRDIGCSVAVTSAAGDGFPDIVVGFSTLKGIRTNLLMEIKDGEKSPSRRGLTDDQKAFHDAWLGQIAVVESVADAVNLVSAAKRR